MTTDRVSEINALCEAWLKAVRRPEGGWTLDGESADFRLLRNGIVFHELTFDESRAAALGLGQVLLLPGLNTIIDSDHLFFWMWMAQVILHPDSLVFDNDHRDVHTLFGTATRAVMANVRPPTASRQEREHTVALDQFIPFHLREMRGQSHLILASLSFPLLEAACKIACADFISLDGLVRNTFTVQRRDQSSRTYGAGQVCSSLRDLLLLLQNDVAGTELKHDLSAYSSYLESVDPSQHGFDLVYRWRNASLHGAASYSTVGGSIYNLAILIFLHRLRGRYAIAAQAAWQLVQHTMRLAQLSSDRPPWSYYPPF
jgi:hypothetical protein